MTTITDDIAVPEGADESHVDDWQPAEKGKPIYRLVWSKPFESHGGLDIRVVVVQFEDGTIAGAESDPDNAPLVYIANSDYHPDDARALAASIIRAADLADQWAGGIGGHAQVCHDALRDVHRRIRNISDAFPATTWTLQESHAVLDALTGIARNRR